MVFLGLDLGSKTLGVSISDRTSTIATSLNVIRYSNYDELIEPLREIIASNDITKIILGYPKNMNNTIGPRALTTCEFKEKLENNFAIKT